MVQTTKVLNFSDLAAMEAPIALSTYCELKNFSPPKYKFYRIPKTTRLQCRVTVNGYIYSTYPNDFATEAEAKMDAAFNAFTQIKETQLKDKYPVCMDTDIELAIKVLECITAMTNGVFKDKIPQIFQ